MIIYIYNIEVWSMVYTEKNEKREGCLLRHTHRDESRKNKVDFFSRRISHILRGLRPFVLYLLDHRDILERTAVENENNRYVISNF